MCLLCILWLCGFGSLRLICTIFACLGFVGVLVVCVGLWVFLPAWLCVFVCFNDYFGVCILHVSV